MFHLGCFLFCILKTVGRIWTCVITALHYFLVSPRGWHDKLIKKRAKRTPYHTPSWPVGICHHLPWWWLHGKSKMHTPLKWTKYRLRLGVHLWKPKVPQVEMCGRWLMVWIVRDMGTDWPMGKKKVRKKDVWINFCDVHSAWRSSCPRSMFAKGHPP